MAKTLGGAIFIKDGVKFDYCFKESIECLCDVCDEVAVVGIQSDDGTLEILHKLLDIHSNLNVIEIGAEAWKMQKGKEKLAYFQNFAKACLSTDYYLLQQGDELIHESCFPFIRKAIETDKEAFYIKRLNLWGDCNHYLSVPENRQPCSTNVIRLAKTRYESVGDGESIDAPAVLDFLDEITMLHYGFVRSKQVMIEKIKNMQTNIFQIPFDPKLNNMEVFDWRAWFSEEDLKLLNMKHPKYIQEWVLTRP